MLTIRHTFVLRNKEKADGAPIFDRLSVFIKD